MAADDPTVRVDKELNDRMRAVQYKQQARTGRRVTLKDMLDAIIEDSLPALEKAEGIA